MKTNLSRKVIEERTNDWVSLYSQPRYQRGIEWYFSTQGGFPEGVNQNDPRVKKIINLYLANAKGGENV